MIPYDYTPGLRKWWDVCDGTPPDRYTAEHQLHYVDLMLTNGPRPEDVTFLTTLKESLEQWLISSPSTRWQRC